ncbi:MAG: SGNH/GDSL hydrolase family protein, partial [Planctomycetota bacterium]|nr:SGNH/GDSL hydrolase family protein [Planctomycetota bacterium]
MKSSLTLIVVILMMCSIDQVNAQVELKKGDRVVFLGDSITQAGARPGGYVALFRQAVDDHFGDGEVKVIGAGISGHKVPDCQKRLQRDVLSQDPTLVVIYIGINDVWHSQNNRGTSKQDYREGLVDLINRIKKAGSKVVLCTPSVIGEKTDGSNSLDKLLDEYCDISRKVAKENEVSMLDLRKEFLDHLKKENQSNKPSKVLTTDGVHLNPAGNRFVCQCVMEATGVRPSQESK